VKLRSASRYDRLIGGIAVWLVVSTGPVTPAVQASAPETQLLNTLSRTFGEVYEHAKAAVVLIKTRPAGGHWREALPPSHPPLPPDYNDSGLGSGTIVRADGIILSNYHVVRGADSISVTLADRREVPAEIVGFDSLIDIAVLKVNLAGLPAATMADSDQLAIGDWVLAIGHPLGMGTTLTHGIVSALNRQVEVIEGEYSIESFIQTNAVINPGNSGGPLLDLSGRVIGINTAISTRTGYFIGYGLAVPANLAREAMEDILAHGRVVRGYLGVEMTEVSQTMMRENRMERLRGVHLQSIRNDTPAARGGLSDGDILLRIDGATVDRPNQVQTLIYRRDPGEVVTLDILRQGEAHRLMVELGERESDLERDRGEEYLSLLGMQVESLSPRRAVALGFDREVASQLQYERGETAVVVAGLEPDGEASSKGIRLGDVITDVDRERVTSLSQFLRFVARLEREQATLFWLWRSGEGVSVRALRVRPKPQQ
jgi:serine protease Do